MKKIVLMMMAVLMAGSGLKAQKRDTLYSEDKSLTDGFIGLSPNGDSIFRIVQVEAKFPDGWVGWRKYLVKNVNSSLGNKYIKIPKGEKCAKATVNVIFLIDKEGNVSDVTADSLSTSTVNEKLVEEAKRVIKDGPKWIPAWQRGHTVSYRAKQKITFVATKD